MKIKMDLTVLQNLMNSNNYQILSIFLINGFMSDEKDYEAKDWKKMV